MLIPSIDLMNGQAVQLRQGRTLVLEAGDPRVIAKRFAPLGEIAVIDLDAALGRGSNAEVIRELLPLARCRVGGGIRDAQTARRWLHEGAAKVILGTAAVPEVLSQLPRERVIAALDARDGEVVVEGWVKPTGRGVLERLEELRPHVGGFLVTFVEIEGTLSGIDSARVTPIVEAAKGCRVTVAGGVRTANEVGDFDRLGADAQVGMAIYQGLVHPADAWSAMLRSDRPDGLWPTIVADESGIALGLVYSNAESLRASIDEGAGVYWSRSRGGLWRKGATSGAVQRLVRIDADCDRDAIRFIVRQEGAGFCHQGTRTCFGPVGGWSALEGRIASIAADPSRDPSSYTARVLGDPTLLASKIAEEGRELAAAATPSETVEEAADVIYFASVKLRAAGVGIADVERCLDRRALKLARRGGDAKPPAVKVNGELLPSAEPSELLRSRTPAVDATALDVAARIMDDIERGGWSAALGHAIRLGDLREGELAAYDASALAKAAASVPASTRGLLERTRDRIRRFAEAQRESLRDLRLAVEGGEAGHRVEPVASAGCYAPGGRFPLPSSVLMTAVTAKAAGVRTVWVASPRPTAVTLAAAHLAGADGLLAFGGAQAVGAFTFGVPEVGIPACDVIAGPGNRFVTAAKHLASRRTNIDMLAGPSEVLVIADESADATIVAADLLAQAEHDPDASSILLTTDPTLPARVRSELRTLLARMPDASVAEASLRSNGRAVVVDSLDRAIEFSDAVAPEHLEVCVRRADEVSRRVRRYGGLFIGEQAAEVLGDYGAGPNHVLPTGGSARSRGGLSVFDFLAVRSWLMCEPGDGYDSLRRDAAELGDVEGLTAHALAARVRGGSEA